MAWEPRNDYISYVYSMEALTQMCGWVMVGREHCTYRISREFFIRLSSNASLPYARSQCWWQVIGDVALVVVLWWPASSSSSASVTALR